MQACKGYVTTTFSIIEVFGVVLSRFYQLLFLFIILFFGQDFFGPQNHLFNLHNTNASLHSQVWQIDCHVQKTHDVFVKNIKLGFHEKTCNWVPIFSSCYWSKFCCRYVGDANMDVATLCVVDLSARLNTYYNSNATCTLPLFDLMNKAKDNGDIYVPWIYGTHNFEL